jgi:hypothetical protein
MKLLNEYDINYCKEDKDWSIKIKLKSGVEITFGNNEVEDLNKNYYLLETIGLTNEKY